MNAMQTRESVLGELESKTWDVVIIGGGITGAGILREAVRHGLKALLVEQEDFAWGTSSRSTKMVHGGMRYLKQGNISLTRESVIERENLIRELPGLVEDRTFIMPFYKGNILQRLLVQTGLIVYNLLSGKWRKNKCSVSELATRAPLLKSGQLKGGFLINDAVTDDSRLVMRVLHEAIKQGARAINYCKAETLLKEENAICGVRLRDRVHGDTLNVQSKLVVNATGAWADTLRKQVQQKNDKHIRPLRGSHIVLSAKRLPLLDNISLIHPEDGRPVITLTWEGRVLMGTTDIDHHDGLATEASISKKEVRYLLDALNFQFPDLTITEKDIISTMAGIRPVIDTGKNDPSKESRDHVIWLEDGLLTVTGGKLTTFRVIALDALDEAQKVLGKLPGLRGKQKVFDNEIDLKTNSFPNLSDTSVKRLFGKYGTMAGEIITQSSQENLQAVPETETLWTELAWAAANEMVVHLDDLMLRRTRIGLLLENGGKEYLPKVKELCREILGWTDETWKQEEIRYLEIWKRHYSLPN